MDETDGYTTSELEEAVDDVGCDGNELEKDLTSIDGRDNCFSASDPTGDLERDSADDEPSLGSLSSNSAGQTEWSRGHSGDLEYDDGDDEPSIGYDAASVIAEADTGDDEPSLGWTDDGTLGNRDDLEDGAGRIASPICRIAKGIGSENLYTRKRLTGLSESQRKAVQARADASQVSL